jgi:hypothetical protein
MNDDGAAIDRLFLIQLYPCFPPVLNAIDHPARDLRALASSRLSPILANGNPVPSEVGSNSMRICGRSFRFSVRTGWRFDCFVPIKAVSRLSLCARQKASLLELFTSEDIQ